MKGKEQPKYNKGEHTMKPISRIIIHDTKTNAIHNILAQNGWLFKYLFPTKQAHTQNFTNIYLPTDEFTQYPQLLDRLKMWVNERTSPAQMEIYYEEDE